MPRQFTPKVVCTCGHCGKQFERCPSQVAPYCGRVCFGLAKRTRQTYSCKQCGTAFYPLTHSGGQRQFCSRACYETARIEARHTAVCPVCGTEHHRKTYCSNACRLARHTLPVIRQCKHCGQQFSTTPSAIGRFCSQACMNAEKRTGAAVPCIICGTTFWQYPSTGQVHCSIACRSVSQRRANTRGRATWRYNAWRKAVLDRDGFACQRCGHQGKRVYRGGGMHAHHLKPYATYPRLRYVVANGVTLCGPCHQAQHPTIPILHR